MDLRLAEMCRTIPPAELGLRLRVARVAAGMTQAGVAGDDVTAAYLSRIETGQRRPSAHLLERLAGRLGTSLEALVAEAAPDERAALELELASALLAVRAGRSDAVDLVDALVTNPVVDQDPSTARRVGSLRADALAAAGDAASAAAVLEGLVDEDDGAGTVDERDRLLPLAGLARCYLEAGRIDQARAAAERAVAVAESLGMPVSAEVAWVLAACYQQTGQAPAALAVASAALEPDRRGSTRERAMTYRAASHAAAEAGAIGTASALARKARVLLDELNAARDLMTLKVMAAEAQLQAEVPDPAAAVSTLQDVELLQAPGEEAPAELAAAYLARGRAQLMLGQLAEARKHARAAREHADNTSAVTGAAALALEARTHLLAGDTSSAAPLLAHAAESLRQGAGDQRAGPVWVEVADLLAEAGDHAAAITAFRAAAESTGLSRATH